MQNICFTGFEYQIYIIFTIAIQMYIFEILLNEYFEFDLK